MSAPSGTIWGGIVGSGSGQGRIGIYVISSSSQTQTTLTMQVWFWTKYGVRDSSNTVHYSFTDTGVISAGSKTINHTVSSGGGWSTSNQTLLGTYSHTYNRETSARSVSCAADIQGIEAIGSGIWVSANFMIPARNRYSISYNANGGSGAPATQYYYYGYNTTLSTQIPTRTGYRFLGWSLSSTAISPSYSAGQAWSGTNASNYVLYAVWERILIDIVFNAEINGGSVEGAGEVRKSWYFGDKLEAPKAEKKNHAFVGWNTNSNGNGDWVDSGFEVTSSLTLYAIFELQANCYIRVNGTYKNGMMYKKVNGSYKNGVLSVKKNGTYKETKV